MLLSNFVEFRSCSHVVFAFLRFLFDWVNLFSYIKININKESLNDWLNDWMIDWLIEWLIDRMIDWLNDWLNEWLIDWLIHWMDDWLIDQLVDSSTDLCLLAHCTSCFLYINKMTVSSLIVQHSWGYIKRKYNCRHLTNQGYSLQEPSTVIPQSIFATTAHWGPFLCVPENCCMYNYVNSQFSPRKGLLISSTLEEGVLEMGAYKRGGLINFLKIFKS